jgi:cytochrome oxidase Cu insertion factor (SCO1/SenC/PrrC family)
MRTGLLSVFIFISIQSLTAQQNNIVIRGYIDNPTTKDSITIAIWKHYYGDEKKYKVIHQLKKQKLNNPSGYFEFIDSSNTPVYITIGQKFNYFNHLGDGLLNKYIAEPGDSITIFRFGSSDMIFYGKGKEKYECRYALDKISAYTNSFTTDTTAQLYILNQYKEKISPFAYDVMFTDIIGKYLTGVSASMVDAQSRKENIFMGKEFPIYLDLLPQIERGMESAKVFSSGYTNAKIISAILESRLSALPTNPYTIIKEKYTGLLREKLLTGYMVNRYELIEKADSLLNDALIIMQHTDYITQLTNLKNKLSKGTVAYDFALPDEQGMIRQLHEFKGKVVFIDFWFSGCSACALYHKRILAPIIESYKNNPDIVFLTINIDAKREQWLASIKTGEYTSPGNINLYTNQQSTNHPVIEQYYVTGFPRPIVIDKYGKIFATSVYELRMDVNRCKEILEKALAH